MKTPHAITFLAAAIIAVTMPACAGWRSAKPNTPPGVSTSVGGVPFVQTGAAAVPASASSKTTTTAATIPPGVTVTAAPDGSLTWMTAAPLAVVTTIRADTATGPAAFAPPAPPTPAEEARGFGVRAFYLAALACAIAAGLCVWRGYPLAALCFGGSALALPILANFFGGMSATIAGVAFVAMAGGLILAYHLTKKTP